MVEHTCNASILEAKARGLLQFEDSQGWFHKELKDSRWIPEACGLLLRVDGRERGTWIVIWSFASDGINYICNVLKC